MWPDDKRLARTNDGVGMKYGLETKDVSGHSWCWISTKLLQDLAVIQVIRGRVLTNVFGLQVRRLILERRASREADLPEEVDGNRFLRKKSADYKEFSNAQTLADLQEKYDQTIAQQSSHSRR